MTQRIAVATCTAWPELDDDGPELLAALAAEGLEVDVKAWDSDTDWATYDLVVIRTTWDYWDRHEEYLAWTRRVPRLANHPDVVAWNTDKSYLRKLEAAGIPIVPTTWIGPGEPFTAPRYAFVVKPSVSAGARDTAAYTAGDESAGFHVADLHGKGKTVMVQPYLDAVDTAGETAVLLFGGQVSHGARKSAVLEIGAGEATLGSWSMTAREPSPAEKDLARRVVDVAQSWGQDLLYARVDLLPGPTVIELEVTEPSLFLGLAPGSAQRYAQAVRRWVDRSTGTATSPS
jgi:hypothetical protein